MHGKHRQGPSTRVYEQNSPVWKMWDSSYLPSSFIPQPTGLLKNSTVLEDPDVSFLPSHSHWGDRKHQVWNVSVCPPTQHTHPNWGLSSLLVLSGSHLPLVCWVSHTQMHSRGQFLTEDGLPSSVPSWVMNKEQFSWISALLEKDFRTKRKWVYWEESAKEPERKTWDADVSYYIKCSNLYTKHVTKHQLILQAKSHV